MSFDFLLRSAAETERTTKDKVRGAEQNIPRAIDALLKLPYFVRTAAPLDTSGFRWWAHGAYASAGHAAGALFLLWRQGFYLESTILLRHLLETLVQLRYFGDRPHELMPHLTRTAEINSRKMFNVCAPGFYPFYSVMAGAAHGGVAASIFRVGLSLQDHQKWRPGCDYDDERAGIVVNQFAPTLLGFLNLFSKHFPEAFDLARELTREDLLLARAEAVAWLESAVNAQLNQFPKSRSWLPALLKLADYSPPPG